MDFDDLNTHIPFVTEGKLHSQVSSIIVNSDFAVQVMQPGKYKDKTEIPGGDFVVVVTCKDAKWKSFKFKHDHLFDDIELKTATFPTFMQEEFAPALADVIYNKENPSVYRFKNVEVPGLHPQALLYASQALALAEHRRYSRFEATGGGRFLPARFALGIIYGHWTSQDAKLVQYTGAPGIRRLEQSYGTPPRLKELARAAAAVGE